MSLPTIQICGNLKRIETKFTQSGKQVTKFQVECAEKNSKGEYVNLYISGEVWDKQAEFVNQYFQDGSVAIVTGKLYTNVYEKQDGSKVYENKLLFPSVSFAPKDKAGQSNNGQTNQAPHQGGYSGNQYQSPQSNQTNHTAYREPQRQMPDARALPSIDIDEDNIPF